MGIRFESPPLLFSLDLMSLTHLHYSLILIRTFTFYLVQNHFTHTHCLRRSRRRRRAGNSGSAGTPRPGRFSKRWWRRGSFRSDLKSGSPPCMKSSWRKWGVRSEGDMDGFPLYPAGRHPEKGVHHHHVPNNELFFGTK